jgi:aminopeptidase N
VTTLADLRTFEIHLADRLRVTEVRVDDKPASFVHRDGLVEVGLAASWRAGSRHRVTVVYGGRPKTAIRPPWIDGFVWSETPSGQPWIGVTGEMEGCDSWWPCKDHPSDEPEEGMDISLTVPGGLVGLANGRPMGEVASGDGTVTSRWRVGFPINSYGVTVNIGPYVPVETSYRGVDGKRDEELVFWAIPEHLDDAERMWRQMPSMLEVLSRRFGEYPFLADKLWVAHAPYLGMEHQTLIAYGGDFRNNDFGFDSLLVHELAHEWWGNKVTASEWGDVWLHEGFASYAEALVVLDTLGEERYLDYMHGLEEMITNQLPLVRGPGLTSLEAFTSDVYGKGAWVLHMIRSLVGEADMAEILWRFADGDDPEACRSASTRDFIDLVEAVSGRSLDWFWDRYLHTTELPSWRVDRASKEASDRVTVVWDDPAFEMPLPALIDGEMRTLAMDGGRAVLEVGTGVEVTVDPRREVLAFRR